MKPVPIRGKPTGGARAGLAGEVGSTLQPAISIAPDGIREQLERILKSDAFVNSARLSRFLRFAVEQTLAGNEERLREYPLGVQVFDKHESFDPRIDSIVRVEARRLRSKLEQYYQGEGRGDPIVIRFHKGCYVPAFETPREPWKRGPEALIHPLASVRARLAVLPLSNLSADAETEFFSVGLTQEIIDALTKVSGLRVVARTSAFQFRDSAADVQRIGEALKVDAILQGSVRRSVQRVRITVQLISVREGYYLWSETYDRTLDDVFLLQEAIAKSVMEAIARRLEERT